MEEAVSELWRRELLEVPGKLKVESDSMLTLNEELDSEDVPWFDWLEDDWSEDVV